MEPLNKVEQYLFTAQHETSTDRTRKHVRLLGALDGNRHKGITRNLGILPRSYQPHYVAGYLLGILLRLDASLRSVLGVK